MIQRLNLHAQCSVLSLGQVGFNLLRELYRRKVQVAFFPRQIELTPFKVDQPFGQWIERSVNSRYQKLDRKVPTLNLWHLSGSETRLSDKQVTLTFHETDSPTPDEINIANQQDATLFTSSWSVDSFRTYGCANAAFVPLGLDEDFAPIGHRLVGDDVTHWILVGKAEQRKNTQMIIQTWVKRYGGKRDHQLTLCVTNPFFKPEMMNAFYQSCMPAGKPFNVNLLPPLKTNAEMNQLYNSADIDLSGFSSAEGWNVPAFTATALGKWSVVTDCSAHKDWATATNSVLVGADPMRPVYDGIFFQQGAPFNQGNIYAFTAEQLDEALTRAEKVARTPNSEGAKLRETHTYAKTLDAILNHIGD